MPGGWVRPDEGWVCGLQSVALRFLLPRAGPAVRVPRACEGPASGWMWAAHGTHSWK